MEDKKQILIIILFSVMIFLMVYKAAGPFISDLWRKFRAKKLNAPHNEELTHDQIENQIVHILAKMIGPDNEIGLTELEFLRDHRTTAESMVQNRNPRMEGLFATWGTLIANQPDGDVTELLMPGAMIRNAGDTHTSTFPAVRALGHVIRNEMLTRVLMEGESNNQVPVLENRIAQRIATETRYSLDECINLVRSITDGRSAEEAAEYASMCVQVADMTGQDLRMASDTVEWLKSAGKTPDDIKMNTKNIIDGLRADIEKKNIPFNRFAEIRSASV